MSRREREDDFEARWGEAGASAAEQAALAAHVAGSDAAPRHRVSISLRQIAQRGVKARERRMRWTIAVAAAVAIAVVWFGRPLVNRPEDQVAERPVNEVAPSQVPAAKQAEPRELALEPSALDRSQPQVEVPIEDVAPRDVHRPKSSVRKAAGKSTIEIEKPSEPPAQHVLPGELTPSIDPPSKLSRTAIEPERDEPAAAPRIEAKHEEPARDRGPEIALYRRALDLLRRGEPEDAAELFREYLTKYPQGSLREEAELSLIEALAAAGKDEELQVEAARWLARHPKHPRADEVRKLLPEK